MKKEDAINIDDLIPKRSSFFLSQFDGKEFKLEPCTAGKLVEMNRMFGNVENMLSMPSASNLSKIATSLMEYESAKTFKKTTVKVISALTGDEEEIEIGGYKLLMSCINGTSEQYGIYAAILESFGYESAKVKSMIKKLKDNMNKAINKEAEKVDVKKKRVAKKKKRS